MVVTWSTAKPTDADVRYAPSDPESSTSANLTLSATGTVREFVDGGSGRTTRYVHAATLEAWRPASGTNTRWATRRWKSGGARVTVHVAPWPEAARGPNHSPSAAHRCATSGSSAASRC